MSKRTEKFTIPCGYLDEEGNLHTEVTVQELDHSVDKDMSNGISSSELVSRHIIELGTYKDSASIEKAVPEMMKGDFDYILLRLRSLSLGSEYTYSQTCRNKRCSFEGSYEYDLDGIEVVDMPNPRDRQFSYTTDNGEELVFRYILVRDTEDLTEMMKEPDDYLDKILGLQLVSIDGVTPAAELHKKGRKCKNSTQHVRQARAMISDLDLPHREREAIRKKSREGTGYPDREVRGECPQCKCNFAHMLPIDYTFIAPSLEASIQHGSL